jgi:hypothetical protein
LFGILTRSGRARELLFEIGSRGAFERARHDDRQISGERIVAADVMGARVKRVERRRDPVGNQKDDRRRQRQPPQLFLDDEATGAVDGGIHDQRIEAAVLTEPIGRVLELCGPENRDTLVNGAQGIGNGLRVAAFAPDIENLHEPPRSYENRLRHRLSVDRGFTCTGLCSWDLGRRPSPTVQGS